MFLHPKAPLWTYGFRPFFLLGSLLAPWLMVRWVLGYSGAWELSTRVAPMSWHAHEMLFGFTGAFVFGFLLTASASWSGKAPVSGGKLMGAVACFAVARALSEASGGLSLFLFSLFDLLSYVVLAALLYPYLAHPRRNFVIFGMLSALFVFNLLFHLQMHEWASFAFDPVRLALHVLLLLLTMISGRVIPFFTSRRLGIEKPVEPKALTIGIVVSIFATGYLDVSNQVPTLLGATGLIAFALQGARLWCWHRREVWTEPMLWVLYIAYAWLAIGYLMIGLSAWNIVLEFTALHAWTAGAISIMIIGMATRVSLGHTGRPIEASPLLRLTFIAMTVAALLRVFGVILWPAHYLPVIVVSGLIWAAAFLVVFVMFLRVWTSPRFR